MYIHIHTRTNTHWLECPDVYVVAFHRPSFEKTTVIRKWCYDTFGASGFRHDIQQTRWNDGIAYGEVEFARESDVALFSLKWS